MTPLIVRNVDWFITTIEDMAKLYEMGCGRYSAEAIDRGDIGNLSDADLKAFTEEVQERFKLSVVGITIRYPDSSKSTVGKALPWMPREFFPLSRDQTGGPMGPYRRRRYLEQRVLLRSPD